MNSMEASIKSWDPVNNLNVIRENYKKNADGKITKNADGKITKNADGKISKTLIVKFSQGILSEVIVVM